MSRNYKKEYDNYHSRPEQKIRRAARNAARRLFANADPDKDVHHKDNNPLNNDKKNLSLVTQYYNRREPRLRDKIEAFPRGTGSTVIVHNNKVIAKGAKSAMLKQMKQIRKKTGDSHKKLFLGNSPSRKIGDVWKEEVDESNYKIKNGKLHISKKDYAKKSKDYKGKRKGKPTLMARDPKTGATTSFEVVFEEVELDEKVTEYSIRNTKTGQVYASGKYPQSKSKLAKIRKGGGDHKYAAMHKDGKVQKEEVDESPLVSNEVAVAKMLSDKFYAMLMKGNFEKKRQLASKIGIKLSQHHKRVRIEQDEEVGTVTGPHIAGTGDDSSTVVVKKKKKKQVYRRESLENKIMNNVLSKTHNKNGGIK